MGMEDLLHYCRNDSLLKYCHFIVCMNWLWCSFCVEIRSPTAGNCKALVMGVTGVIVLCTLSPTFKRTLEWFLLQVH